ncbi:winged helix-turn-helix domain-containing protein [Pseudoalteromonas sp. T1lg23B]|uniref:winged helix-turn-helix domain-containing protein n=1 Tax=Pseudoalteromonas sp. T1lg23B TaxID=2077097 RepID=UPI000CF6B96A|nr:winged helix-turn-helix domain-containing protein [Pseudoalteromonas sp. T1lg23B]
MSVIEFGEFQFNLALSQLKHNEQEVVLDPRQQALLVFFIQNPQRVINRDELQEHIWQGVIVTDNAINKLVANLRKALGDDAKEPKYIQTVTKSGYRFVAPVSVVAHTSDPSPVVNPRQQSLRVSSLIWLLLGIIIVFAVLSFLLDTDARSKKYGDTSTLTRFHGSKLTPIFLDDSESLLFINVTLRERELWLSHGVANSRILPVQVESQGHFIDQLVAYRNGRLVYFGYESECGWYSAEFDPQTKRFGEDVTTLALCGDLTVHQSMLNKEGDGLFVLAHPKMHEHNNQLYITNSEQQLERVKIELDKQWRIVSIDLHPHDERILLNAHSFDGKTAAFVYDPTSQQVRKEKEFNSILERVIWDHSGEGLVFVSPAPNSRLLYQALDSDEATLLGNVNERLCCAIVRHPNNQDYVFTSSDKNIDLKWLSPNYALDNSSVIDRSPLFAHMREGHYFLSNRAGVSQIYFQAPDQTAQLVSELAHNVQIESMSLSNDDEFLLLREKHRLWIVPTSEHAKPKDIFIDGYVYKQHWLSNTLFSVTLKHRNSKQVIIYNSELQKVAQLGEGIVIVLADQLNPANHYYVDKQNKLYKASPDILFSSPSTENLPVIGDIPDFSQLLIENDVLYVVSKYGETLTTYKITDSLQLLSKQPLNAYLGFDVDDGVVLYAGKAHYRSEVYRTLAR